jgi:hypothetical protein
VVNVVLLPMSWLDIRTELEGAESSVQEYPEIIAFMKMLQQVLVPLSPECCCVTLNSYCSHRS